MMKALGKALVDIEKLLLKNCTHITTNLFMAHRYIDECVKYYNVCTSFVNLLAKYFTLEPFHMYVAYCLMEIYFVSFGRLDCHTF